MKLSELASVLNADVTNSSGDVEVTGISTLGEAAETDISFVTDKKYLGGLADTKACAILIPESLAPIDKPYIALKDVWSGILASLKLFFPDFSRKTYSGIHPTAVIDATAQLGADVTIAPNAVVGPRTRVESGCYIGAGVVVGADCVLGEQTIIYANAVLEAGTVLGRQVIVQPGAVLGADGFKYELLRGRWAKIPQVGHVEIADGAEVGANSCVDRASYTVTQVGANSKLDNLVQVAHNVRVGENCVIVSQTGIAGSTTIGNNSILAAQAGVADNLTIGSGAVVLAQSGVKDHIKDGETHFGTPSRPFRQAARIIGIENKLPELAAEVARLSAKIAELEARLTELNNKRND